MGCITLDDVVLADAGVPDRLQVLLARETRVELSFFVGVLIHLGVDDDRDVDASVDGLFSASTTGWNRNS